MIEAQNVTKAYGATVAVNDISFTAQKGEIVGFLGPNGAGKSTTIKILTCYIVADSGKVTVAGHDVLEDSLGVRQVVGYLPETTAVYLDMRVSDYLDFVARARQISGSQRRSAIDRVVQLTGIERMLKKDVGHLSKGYKQRVGIAQALIHDPDVLILDEPTSGLDPHQIIEIRRLIQDLGQEKLVLFSSHILQEISAICTRLMVICDGRLVANGSPGELVQQAGRGRQFQVQCQGGEELSERLRGLSGVTEVRDLGREGEFNRLEIVSGDGRDLGPEIFDLVSGAGFRLGRIEEKGNSLEDVYLSLTAAARRAS